MRPAGDPVSGIGSVTRPDGHVIGDVAYEITIPTRAQQPAPPRRCTVRMRVLRPEALFWFFECGSGLRLRVSDGQVLPFGLMMIPDDSGWIEVSTPRPWSARWRWLGWR